MTRSRGRTILRGHVAGTAADRTPHDERARPEGIASDLALCGERVTGIEPAWPAWKAGALPLSYTRIDHAGSDGDRRAWPSG